MKNGCTFFSLKRVGEGSGIRDYFYWHDCECGLPTIICRTSVFLEHKDINNDQKQLDIDFSDFFEQTESYIWAAVLPKEGKVKYSWIDFSRELHRQVANGERYRKYREYRYPDPDESSLQLPLDTLESQLEESPEQGIILINLSPPEMNSVNPEWDKVKGHDPPEVNSEPPEEDEVIEYPTYSGPPERDKVMDDDPPEAKSSPPEVNSEPPEEDNVREYPTYSGPPERDKVIDDGKKVKAP